MEVNNKSFTERHPGFSSVVGVVIWFFTIVLLTLLGGCRSVRESVIRTDTLYVYHTDTTYTSHTDTVKVVVTKVVRDSVVQRVTNTIVIDRETGDTIHTEVERDKEAWHDADREAWMMEKRVDSVVNARVDSVMEMMRDEKVATQSQQTGQTWWERLWEGLRSVLDLVGALALGGLVVWGMMKRR